MLEGACPKCGARYYGWALRNPRNQMCHKCGTALRITDEGGRPFIGYSPFTAENIIKPQPGLSSVDETRPDGSEKSGTA